VEGVKVSRFREFAHQEAYVPEHLIDYVEAVSGAEPHLRDGFIMYRRGDALTVVGYPLGKRYDERELERTLRKALREFFPRQIHLIGDRFSFSPKGFSLIAESRDDYFSLDLNSFHAPPAVTTMVRRALKEAAVERNRTFSEEHRELLGEFLSARNLGEATRIIMERIPEFVAKTASAVIISARDREGRLVAFDVAEVSVKWAFYMFNVASRQRYVPGVSDLLLNELIGFASEQGKRNLNLGLGIKEGVAFFKSKWGGVPFLPYQYLHYERDRTGGLDRLLERL
jgi:hypothetical protein